MNKQRRAFLGQISVMAGMAAISKPLASAASVNKHINDLRTEKNSVTVYHTNDMQGNINTVYKGMGGLYKMKSLMRSERPAGLMLDAGGFLNTGRHIADQKDVIALMNEMGYHAAVVSQHELAAGAAHLQTLAAGMKFTLINTNHEFGSELNGSIEPYLIVDCGGIKTGIIGVSAKLEGATYSEPIASANRFARMLKENENCGMVICLSHLGLKQEGNKPDNQKLAAQSEHIDMIIGGDNNKLSTNTRILQNKLKHEVIVAHAAWNGLMMGRTIINFNNKQQKTQIRAKHFIPGAGGVKQFSAAYAQLRQVKAPWMSA